MQILFFAVTVIAAYLFGSISPAIIISNSIAQKDIREFGSGNAGSTNMIRTFGWKIGLLTFILDVLKGAATAFLCLGVAPLIGDQKNLLIMFGCIAAILGHGFPIYYKFRGGKGVASTLGIFLVLMTTPTLGALGVSLVLILISGRVSVGSIVGMILCSVFSFIVTDNLIINFTILILALFTIFLHRENIVRIIKGTERKLSFKK